MSTNIDIEQVRHIARLARIELTDQEAQTFRGQLAAILESFGKLNELDTANVAPLVHAVELHNALADDTPRTSLTTDEALANAPARQGDFFQVPKVIGDSQ